MTRGASRSAYAARCHTTRRPPASPPKHLGLVLAAKATERRRGEACQGASSPADEIHVPVCGICMEDVWQRAPHRIREVPHLDDLRGKRGVTSTLMHWQRGRCHPVRLAARCKSAIPLPIRCMSVCGCRLTVDAIVVQSRWLNSNRAHAQGSAPCRAFFRCLPCCRQKEELITTTIFSECPGCFVSGLATGTSTRWTSPPQINRIPRVEAGRVECVRAGSACYHRGRGGVDGL